VSIVAMQPDYPWFKVRPMLDQLVAKHSVRFELHFMLTNPERYLAPSIALCAAAKAGKFGDLEKQLATTRKPDPALLKVDDATSKACQAAIDQDRKALHKKHFEGVPTFVIGKATIFGAEPIEKFEAAIKAAGG
jgi:protein-disulfide isomerase